MLTVKDLDVSYGDGPNKNHAVRKVSFRCGGGVSFGLVGESGSGKSTVLHCISGLIAKWSGTIMVDGKSQSPRRDRTFYKNVQLVFQDSNAALHPRHIVETLLAEPAMIHKLGDVDRRVRVALAEVGLKDSIRYRFPHQLSGGQRQRVGLARALILNPRILLLDEPTAGLDMVAQSNIIKLLNDLRRTHGLSYLIVSHDLAVIAELCEWVGVMKRGQLTDTQLSEHLITRKQNLAPYTRKLVDAASNYVKRNLGT